MSIRVHTTRPVQLEVLSQVVAVRGSSFGQVDDGYPLVHTAALPAESVHFAQSGVLPRCGMWTLRREKEGKRSEYRNLWCYVCLVSCRLCCAELLGACKYVPVMKFQRSHGREGPQTCLPNAQEQVLAGPSSKWVSLTCTFIKIVHKETLHNPVKDQNTPKGTLTVTRTQCRSIGSPPLCFPPPPPPSISARRPVLLTLRMLMSFSQQNA